MLPPSFNIKDIHKAAVEAFPELQLKIESLPITDLGKSLARNSPGIITLFDLIMLSYPDGQEPSSFNIYSRSFKKVGAQFEPCINYVHKLIEESHSIYRDSTISQLYEHFIISKKPEKFISKHFPDLAGLRSSLVQGLLWSLPKGYLKTVDELLSFNRFCALDLVTSQVLEHRETTILDWEFVVATREYCLFHLAGSRKHSPLQPFDSNPKFNHITNYSEFKAKLALADTCDVSALLREWEKVCLEINRRKNTAFISEYLGSALLIAHQWYQWSGFHLKAACRLGDNRIRIHNSFFDFVIKRIEQLATYVEVIFKYHQTKNELHFSEHDEIEWVIASQLDGRIRASEVTNGQLEISVDEENYEMLQTGISDVVRYIFHAAVVYQREDILRLCAPYIDKFSVYDERLMAFIGFYNKWPLVLKLVKDTPGITTQKLYKALQVDGRSFRPILVAGEQNGFISIEDGKLHLDT